MSYCYSILKYSLVEETGGKASGDGHNMSMKKLLYMGFLTHSIEQFHLNFFSEHNYASLHDV